MFSTRQIYRISAYESNHFPIRFIRLFSNPIWSRCHKYEIIYTYIIQRQLEGNLIPTVYRIDTFLKDKIQLSGIIKVFRIPNLYLIYQGTKTNSPLVLSWWKFQQVHRTNVELIKFKLNLNIGQWWKIKDWSIESRARYIQLITGWIFEIHPRGDITYYGSMAREEIHRRIHGSPLYFLAPSQLYPIVIPIS